MASMAMESTSMPGGATPPSPLPSPAHPRTFPRTISHTANTAPPEIPLRQSTPPIGSGITSMLRTIEQGGQVDGDLQAGLVRVKLEAAAGDVPRSGPSSKKKGKKKYGEASCGKVQPADDAHVEQQITNDTRVEQRDGSEVPISTTVGGKRSLSHASESSRARKAAKSISSKVIMSKLQNPKTAGRKLPPIVSRSPVMNMYARKKAHSHVRSPSSHARSPIPAETSKSPNLHDLSPTPVHGSPTNSHDLSPCATNGSKHRPRKLTSIVWKEAEPIYIDGFLMQGRCKYCNTIFLASKVSGSSQLARHLKVCEVKCSMDGVIQQIRTSDEIDPDWKFDQEAARLELVKLIVLHGLPFSFVEYAGFRKFYAFSFSDWDDHVKLKKARSRNELQRYLEDDFHPRTTEFDILKWWDVNSARYPTLGRIARDVLAIPASSVASESAFSTCGRVIIDHRSSLAPETVEALMCYGDWIKPDSSSEGSTSHSFDS